MLWPTTGLRQGLIRRPCRLQQGESSKHSAHPRHFPRFFPEGGNGPWKPMTRSIENEARPEAKLF